MLALSLWAPSRCAAEVEPLTLYQKTARAPLVVRARALSDSTRRPRLKVLEIYKGTYPASELTIVPHFEDRTHPTPWLKREVFQKDAEIILFLTPYVDDFGREGGPETFSVLNADQGKLDLPTEGADALVGALRRFVAILSSGQMDSQSSALRALLSEKNPYLLEAGLTECAKYHLTDQQDVDTLRLLLKHPRPDFRSGALRLLAQVVGDRSTGGEGAAQPQPGDPALFDQIAETARFDAEESVRREAVAAVAAFGDAAALALVESIGSQDASQSVRYEAQVTALRMRQKPR